MDEDTHSLPWGTIVQVQRFDFRSAEAPFLAPESRGTTFDVFVGPDAVSLEVRIEKVITDAADCYGDDAQRELQLFQYLGPWFRCRRLVRNNTEGQPDWSKNSQIDMEHYLVCLPMERIDAAKFKKAGMSPPADQIYSLDIDDQPTFQASNGARGLTLWHTTCSTPLVDPPAPAEIC